MSKPVETSTPPQSDETLAALLDVSDHKDTKDSDYGTLADALEQTLFDSFDTGLYIGIMSGTSLDGMDVVLCAFNDIDKMDDVQDTDTGDPNTEEQALPMRVVATYTQDFPPQLREVLLALCQPNGSAALDAIDRDSDNSTASGFKTPMPDAECCSELDWFGWASRAYAEFASDVVNRLLAQASVAAASVLAIGCHGQTVRHRPQLGFSLQLLDANILAERTGISVVSDFRRRDMAVGGQGAPLVPAFHQALFASPRHHRVLLNLGGIANITVLPPRHKASDVADSSATNSHAPNSVEQVIGYDTGPANLLLDAWASTHIDAAYDADGAWARSGRVIAPLLDQLLSHPFFAQSYPKSTGREDFNLGWLQAELQRFDQTATDPHYAPEDVQATLTELTAISACTQITTVTDAPVSAVYVCGGGALNGYLMSRIAAHLPQTTVQTSAALGMAPTWVEAAAFAWLARQTLRGETGNVPAVTGATTAVVLGQVCFA